MSITGIEAKDLQRGDTITGIGLVSGVMKLGSTITARVHDEDNNRSLVTFDHEDWLRVERTTE